MIDKINYPWHSLFTLSIPSRKKTIDCTAPSFHTFPLLFLNNRIQLHLSELFQSPSKGRIHKNVILSRCFYSEEILPPPSPLFENPQHERRINVLCLHQPSLSLRYLTRMKTKQEISNDEIRMSKGTNGWMN